MNIRYYTPTLYLDDILIRKSPPAYQDGVYEPAGQDRPNPFTISEIAHKGESGLGSARNRTAMLVYFGKTFDLSYKSIWKTTNFDFYFSNWKNFRVRIFFPKCVAVDLILKTIFITSSGHLLIVLCLTQSHFLSIKLCAFPTEFCGRKTK